MRSWIHPAADSQHALIENAIDDPDLGSLLVEACVATHYNRYFPTYYIKAAGEVDVAYVDRGRFWPIEVKWAGKLRTGDLKQIAKYPGGRIFSKTRETTMLRGIPVEPLPHALFRLKRPEG